MVWASEVDALGARQEKRVEIFSAEQYDGNFPPDNLQEFASWLDSIVEEIPEEHRETAEIEISSYYDSRCGRVTISYRRPETDAEWESRKRDVLERVRQQEDAERQAYEALKAKFERNK